MADLGRWSGGSATHPTESWASPNGLGTTQDRNDGSVYSWSSTNARLTLPSSNLADGYLAIARLHYHASHNNRHTHNARFTENAGTGNFLSATTGGYSRNNANDENYVLTWAIVDNPSAGYTLDYEWKRDTGDGTTAGNVVSFVIEVIPLYYSDIGLYSSTNSDLLGGTTPQTQPLTTTVLEGTNITRSGNVISVTGDNKRYLIFGSNYTEGRGGRTQRWIGGEYDGSQDRGAMACIYHRDTGTDENGLAFSDIIETATATRTIEQFIYRGDGIANNQGGADIDGNNPAVGAHAMAVIELNDSCEVIRSSNAGASAQNIDLGEATNADISFVNTVDFNDSGSFTKTSATQVNCEQAMDVLGGFNGGAASRTVSSGSRYTGRSNLTVNGTEDTALVHGNYGRNNQSSTDTFGFSVNPIGFRAVSLNDDLGWSITENGDSGDFTVQPAWAGGWFINLDTMEDSGVSASGAATMTAVEASGTATRNVQASDGSPDVPLPTASGTATVRKQASGAATLAALVAAGTATVGAPIEASGDPSLPAVEAAATAKRAIQAIEFVVEDEATDFTDYLNGPEAYVDLAIVSGKFRDSTVGLGTAAAWRTGETYADDQWSEIEIATAVNADQAFYQCSVRGSVTPRNVYIGVIQPQGDGTCDLWIEWLDDSTFNTISDVVNITHTLADGDRLRLEVQGTHLNLLFNDTWYVSAVDTNATSGDPGLAIATTSGDDLADHEIERVEYGNLVAIPYLTGAGTAEVKKVASGTPDTPVLTAAGTALVRKQASDGTPDVPLLTAAGTAKTVKVATDGTPSIPLPTASGDADVTITASGSPSIPLPTAAGTTKLYRQASGTPSIPAIEAAGTASGEAIDASGSPDIPVLTSAGTASKLDKPKTSVRVSFPSPTNNVDPATDAQSFKAYVRKDAAGGTNPTLRAYLYEDGVQRQDLGALTVTSETGQLLEWSWTGSNLTDQTGVDVELFLEVDTLGVGSNRRTVEYGAIEWCARWAITASDGGPDVPLPTAAGTATVVKYASGTPSIPAIEAAATAKVARQASDGTPSIPLPVGDGEASSNVVANGSATTPLLTAAGTALVHRAATDGSPAVPLPTAAGTATNHRTATDGTPTLGPVEASGSAVVARQASDGGPSVPLPTASGQATKHITASDGAPEIPLPTANGSAGTSIAANGDADVPLPDASGSVGLRRKASGTPLTPLPSASGTALVRRVASGNANVPVPVGAGTIKLYRQASGNGIVPLPVGDASAALGSDGSISRVVPLEGIFDPDCPLDGLFAPEIALDGIFDGEELDGVFDPDADLDGTFDSDRALPGKGDPV